VLYFPALITGVLPWEGVQEWIQTNLVSQDSLIYIFGYGILIGYYYAVVRRNSPAARGCSPRMGHSL
jgi:hypothetical protein